MGKLNKRQSRDLRKLLKRSPFITQGQHTAENFLLLYVGFEAVARKLWHYYRSRRKVAKISCAAVPLQQLRKAVEYFDLPLYAEITEILLDSSLTKRNHKSARNLRNGMVHQWSEPDCLEVVKRYQEFENAMHKFRAAVKSAL